MGTGPLAPGLTPLTILNTNDFHGHFTKDFACTVTTAQRQLPNALFVSAGDNVGGSPFASASQQDNPAIDYLNTIGLRASAVGNHEFDRGFADLTGRVQKRAAWTYLGANVYRKGTQTAALPEYRIITQKGVRVALVGAVTKDVPALVSQQGIANLDFGDPVSAVNRVAAQLRDGNPANGEADVVVAEYHEGSPVGGPGVTLPQAMSASATFAAIVQNTSPKVDAIFTGHTHQLYAWDGATTPGTRPVIQTGYYAAHLGVLTLGYDPKSKRVTQYRMTNQPVTPPTAACAADQRYVQAAKIVDTANAKAEQIGKQKIGSMTAPITTAYSADGSRDDRSRESTLSNLIAQSYVDSINKPGRIGGVDLGVMNPGGVRAELNRPDKTITYADAASIMPFSNTIVTKQFTGTQLVQALEQQWQPAGSSRAFLKLGLSKNLTYTYNPTAPNGSHITSVMFNGKPLEPNRVYTVASNSFLMAGGDNFTAFAAGTGTRDSGLIDQSLFVEWIRGNSPLTPSFAAQSAAVAGQPDTVTPGTKVKFTVSGLDLSSLGSPKNTSVEVFLGTVRLGTFPVVPGRIPAPPWPTRDGSAAVTVTIPTGTPNGNQLLSVRATPSGTVARLPITVSGGSSLPS